MSSTLEIQEVTLMQMLDAREQRVFRQKELLRGYQKPLLCFTMNIAGPVKNSLLIKRGFLAGIEDLELQLQRSKAKILHKEVISEVTGNEALYVIDTDAFLLKRLACELEDANRLGRLYDMDVILPAGGGSERKLDRQEVGLPGRRCLLCGAPAKECSSRRIHSVPELQEETWKILINALNERYASRIAELAVRALLYEVAISPKPGLVDRYNNGSHRDMNIYTFLNSAAALWPYFKECALMGLKFQEEGTQNLPSLFQRLRLPGRLAESHMLRATDNVNTHKGAIFSMGILCAAIGANAPESWQDSNKLLQTCAEMTKGLVASDFSSLTPDTARTVGQRLYLEYGITGVRGQMEEGLPVVSKYGLPLLEKLLDQGKSIDEAGSAVLLTIIAHMTDTNLIARSNILTQQKAARAAKALLDASPCPEKGAIEDMDKIFIKENLSPGGSADLLAVCWMLHFIKNSGY